MAGRFQPRSTPADNLRIILRSIPWRLLILLPVLLLVAIPAFYYGAHAGKKIFPAVTNFFYNMSGPPPAVVPTPFPAYPTVLPQVGSLLYTVQSGDSCDEILAVQMHMVDAGTTFTDVKPNTVKALDASIGEDCHALQPGMVLTLSPHYPLIAFGGQVLKINATSPQQVLPTPLINVHDSQQLGVDCTSGCILTVQLSLTVQVYLTVQTALPVKVHSWVWAQAMMARKIVPNFDNYPYADPFASLNGMSLRACDLQIDNTHDDNSLGCDQLTPNTIDDDNGAWLFGVVGPSALDHWRYNLHLPANTRVLVWLTLGTNGNLYYRKGSPVYRYDGTTGLYVKG